MLTLRQMRRNVAGIAILIIVPTAAILWLWASAGSAAAPTVPTGAGFSLALTPVPSRDVATLVAGTVEKAPLPAFTRQVSGGRYQVVVGPYATIDEAERAQRQLRRRGLGASMLVDESVRRPAEAAGVVRGTSGPEAGVNLVLVGGAGRYSLVLELSDRVDVVAAPRTRGSLVEVEAGPLAKAIAPQIWDGPRELDLVNQIAIEGFERGGAQFVRARLALSDGVAARSRKVGTRVYIDFWRTDAASDARETVQVRRASHVGQTLSGVPGEPDKARPTLPQPPAALSVADYRAAVAPVVDRLESMRPFIASALASPSADVLQALSGSLSGLETWTRDIEPPAEAAGEHAALAGKIQDALHAVSAATPHPPQSTPPQP